MIAGIASDVLLARTAELQIDTSLKCKSVRTFDPLLDFLAKVSPESSVLVSNGSVIVLG